MFYRHDNPCCSRLPPCCAPFSTALARASASLEERSVDDLGTSYPRGPLCSILSTSQGTSYTPSGLPFPLLKGIVSYRAASGLLIAVGKERGRIAERGLQSR